MVGKVGSRASFMRPQGVILPPPPQTDELPVVCVETYTGLQPGMGPSSPSPWLGLLILKEDWSGKGRGLDSTTGDMGWQQPAMRTASGEWRWAGLAHKQRTETSSWKRYFLITGTGLHSGDLGGLNGLLLCAKYVRKIRQYQNIKLIF